jgi:uncharacterized peroxidase-related enzyme
LTQAIIAGAVPPELPDRDKAMMEYATKLTQNPNSMTSTDVATLRDNGFSDRAILEINLVAAYMNFVNRIALGMGVEIEGAINEFTR